MYDEHVQRGVSGVEVVSDGEGYATNFCTQVIIILLQLGQNAAFGGKIFRFWIKFHWNQFTMFDPVGNKWRLFQVMDWRWANDKPLCEHDKNDKNQGTYVDNLMSLEAYMSLKIRTICPSDIGKSWALFQYSIRRLILRSLEASKPQDLYLELSCRFGIWQAPRQHCCRSACQISKWCSILKYQSCGSATTQDLTIRCVIGYWNRAQLAKCYKIYPWSRLSYTFEADVYLCVSVLLLI